MRSHAGASRRVEAVKSRAPRRQLVRHRGRPRRGVLIGSKAAGAPPSSAACRVAAFANVGSEPALMLDRTGRRHPQVPSGRA